MTIASRTSAPVASPTDSCVAAAADTAPTTRGTLSFRAKLLLAMMLVVAAVTTTTLAVTRRFVERAYARVTRERFTAEADAFAALQEARLAAARSRVRNLARSVRLVAAVNERDVALLYKIAVDELRNVLELDPDAGGLAPATFFRVLDGGGTVLPPPSQQAGLVDDPGRPRWEPQVAAAARAAIDDRVQHIGYLDPRVGDRRVLHEVIVTPIVDRFADKAIGALAIGFPAEERDPAAARIPRGVWLGRRLYSPTLDTARGGARRLRAELRARLPAAAAAAASGDFDVVLEDHPYRVFYRHIGLDPDAQRTPTSSACTRSRPRATSSAGCATRSYASPPSRSCSGSRPACSSRGRSPCRCGPSSPAPVRSHAATSARALPCAAATRSVTLPRHSTRWRRDSP